VSLAIATVEIRKALVRGFEDAGLGNLAVAKAFKGSVDDEVPEVFDLAEVPPRIDPPGPHQHPTVVVVSARLVRTLRKFYGPKGLILEGQRLGSIPQVEEWLATLKPGQVRPRVTLP
jgi:hypothetical protein